MRLSKDRVASVVDAAYGQQMLTASDRAQAGNIEGDQVWTLLVDEIEPDPEQPRRHFDENSLRELADDIARRGVLQPILVQPIEREDSGFDQNQARYRIVVGERRWRASKMAGKPRIPCLIRASLSSSEVREAQLVENIIRQGISDIERGLALRRLYEDMKSSDRRATWETVAAKVGLSRMRIHHLYTLSLLPEPVVEMIQSRRLSGSHGVELARLGDTPETLIALAEEACRPLGGSARTYGLSVAEVRQRASELLQGQHHRSNSADDAGEAEHDNLHTQASPNQQHQRRTSPASMERRMGEIVASLRPGLPHEVRERLRHSANEILQFLDAQQDEDIIPGEQQTGGGERQNHMAQSRNGRPATIVQREISSLPPPSPSGRKKVKSTLQKSDSKSTGALPK